MFKGIYYMVCSFEKVALYSPVIASSVPFAMRRTKRGIDAMDDNPYFGTANIMIAGGQTLKGIRAAKDLTLPQTSAAESIRAANITAKSATATNTLFKTVGKMFDYTSKHINPLICCASGIKVLGADDKEDAVLREECGLLGMFGMEAGGKAILGMPKNVIDKEGNVKTVPREGLYHKNPFVEKQVKALEDYCKTKKLCNKISLKSLPGVAKGLSFVFLFSVPGYKLGQKGAELILGKENTIDSAACNSGQINNSDSQVLTSVQAA